MALYDDVKALDQGIADRWKRRSKGDPDYELKGKDVEAIVFPLLERKRKITEQQALAIMKLVDNAKFSDEGLMELRVQIQVAEKFGFLQAGAKALTSADDLKPITDAIGMAACGRIIFNSPGTGLTYSPRDYLAVHELITGRKINVFEVRLGRLYGVSELAIKGSYESDKNNLFVYEGVAGITRNITLVHEVTHSIQDWRDVRAKTKFIEADAFIAQGIADHALGSGTVSEPGALADLYFAAARLAIDGKSGQDWIDAYEAVVAAIEEHPSYAERKNKIVKNVQRGERSKERDAMDAVVARIDRQLQIGAAIGKAAADAVRATLKRTLGDALRR